MYSFSLIDSTWPRTMRPTAAQPKNPSTMITIGKPAPMNPKIGV